MTCRTVVGALVDVIERTLEPRVRGEIDSHFEHCPACVRFMETYHKTTAICRQVLVRRAPPGLESRLMSYLHEQTGRVLGTGRESG